MPSPLGTEKKKKNNTCIILKLNVNILYIKVILCSKNFGIKNINVRRKTLFAKPTPARQEDFREMFLLNENEESPKDILLNELKYKVRVLAGIVFVIRTIPTVVSLFSKGSD
ncbi:hypothetical protein C922_01603 [Plasmodium inui San Antonio 1]|uniref:Uncharacterized protein n=1 Tax=Plasmodium inui San Antonio 1 TaxID=1237626 RepID=W7ARB2_9APIC|nr:hypothetical protein C922_01603 [Plasmodium inui San Antonio 1]EUD67991.1 hypothetical protein C922_01603 [Plasmodium inui San Antonio 1]